MVEVEQRMDIDRTSRSLFGRDTDANAYTDAESNAHTYSAYGVAE